LVVTTLSNSQFGLHTTFNSIATLIVIQSRLHPLFDELLHLLWCPPHETLRLEEGGEILLDRVEVRISLYPLDKIVLETKLLNLVGGLMR